MKNGEQNSPWSVRLTANYRERFRGVYNMEFELILSGEGGFRVEWGDGTAEEGELGAKYCTLLHLYARRGPYPCLLYTSDAADD